MFRTRCITLPRPDAAYLLAIKQGELAYNAVTEEIETLLSEIEAAATGSSLPEAPDLRYIDDLVIRAYSGRVVGAYGSTSAV